MIGGRSPTVTKRRRGYLRGAAPLANTIWLKWCKLKVVPIKGFLLLRTLHIPKNQLLKVTI
jgi:hypothetical protein